MNTYRFQEQDRAKSLPTWGAHASIPADVAIEKRIALASWRPGILQERLHLVRADLVAAHEPDNVAKRSLAFSLPALFFGADPLAFPARAARVPILSRVMTGVVTNCLVPPLPARILPITQDR